MQWVAPWKLARGKPPALEALGLAWSACRWARWRSPRWARRRWADGTAIFSLIRNIGISVCKRCLRSTRGSFTRL